MSSFPYGLLIPVWDVFVDPITNLPLVGGSLNFYEAGTLTTQIVYGDAQGMTSLGAVVTLNGAGQPSSGGSPGTPTGVFIPVATGYKCIVLDVNGATKYTQDQMEIICCGGS